jgi:hypothetical protein
MTDNEQKPQGLRLEWNGVAVNYWRAKHKNLYADVFYQLSPSRWDWYAYLDKHRLADGTASTQLEAQLACESALESIYLSLRKVFDVRETAKNEKELKERIELQKFWMRQTAKDIDKLKQSLDCDLDNLSNRLTSNTPAPLGEAPSDATIEKALDEIVELSECECESCQRMLTFVRKHLKEEK